MTMLPDRSIPRPTFAEVFADHVTEEVRHWIAGLQNEMDSASYSKFVATLPSDPTGDNSLAALLRALANEAKKDAFAYGEMVKAKLEWPVNAELIEIFKRFIDATDRKHLRERTMDWVMKTGFRFPLTVGAEGDFRDPTVSYKRRAKVLSVDKVTASATIEFINDPKRTLTIYAEQLAA